MISHLFLNIVNLLIVYWRLVVRKYFIHVKPVVFPAISTQSPPLIVVIKIKASFPLIATKTQAKAPMWIGYLKFLGRLQGGHQPISWEIYGVLLEF
jgi:hypothetical protein